MSRVILARCSSRRLSFTLLEFLIVMTLLFGVGSFVTINYKAALSEARFSADVKGFYSLLHSINEATLIGFDPMLDITRGERGIHVVYQEGMGGFAKREFDYPSFNRFTYEGKEPPIPLFFGSKGAIYPKGRILIEGEETIAIDLLSPLMKIQAVDVGDLPYPAWVREACKKK